MVANALIDNITQVVILEAHRQNVVIVSGNRCWKLNTETGRSKPCRTAEAQLDEQGTLNPLVAGSNPAGGTEGAGEFTPTTELGSTQRPVETPGPSIRSVMPPPSSDTDYQYRVRQFEQNTQRAKDDLAYLLRRFSWK